MAKSANYNKLLSFQIFLNAIFLFKGGGGGQKIVFSMLCKTKKVFAKSERISSNAVNKGINKNIQ